MKKSVKGAIAAGGAAVLLVGGAGSLAYWTDSSTVNGGSITTGSLDLSDGTCGANWVYAPGNAKAGQTIGRIVPGDSVTKTCSFTVTAAGDNLRAEVTAPSTVGYTESTPAATTDSLTVTTAYKLDTAALANGAVITSADSGKTLTAAFTVTLPYGSTTVNANDTQNWTATLNTLTVSVKQLDPNS